MKKILINSLGLFLAITFLFTSCDQNEELAKPDRGESTISVAAMLEASLKQMVSSNGKVAAERTITGTLTASNLDEGITTEHDWYAVIDEDAFTVSSSKTIVLEPGTYDFKLVLADGNHAYAGNVPGEVIEEGDHVISMTLKPVFGDVNVDFTVFESANLKLSYPVEDLAQLTNPFIGLSINDGPERIYQINPLTGFNNVWINLAFGDYKFVLTLYDGETVLGRSNPDQEMVNVSTNQNLLIDILPLYAEVMLDLNLEGNEVTFNFVLPQPVVDEVGGLENLQAVFNLNSTVNGDQELLLDFTSGEGGITATHTFTNFRYDIVNLSLVFSDMATGDEIGYSSQSGVVLSSETQDLTMELDLRRRAIINGRILAVLGVNVFDLGNAAVAGAEIYVDDELAGITGSGAFGTAGYLRLFLTQGTYTITAINAETGYYGEEVISLLPLDVANVDIILNQQQTGMGLLVRNGLGFEDGSSTILNDKMSEVFGSGNVVGVTDYEDLDQLMQFKALFLSATSDYNRPEGALTSSEIANIQAFVAAGGKVVLTGENHIYWNDWNASLAAVVGATYLQQLTDGPLSRVNVVPGLTENAATVYVGAAAIFTGGTTLYGQGEVSYWADKAVTFLDYNAFSNGYINNADNLVFMNDLILWLNN